MDSGNVTQWEAVEWVWKQAPYLTASQHHVLVYLVCHAFYTDENPEEGDVGQVMRKASYIGAVAACTSLSRATVKRALLGLQEAGYLQREVRQDPNIYGQQPSKIYVLWDFENLREGLRKGTMTLPEELIGTPVHRPEKAPILELVTNS